MKVLVLLLFVVGCRCVQWKPISHFKDAIKEISKAAVDTISSIQKVFETSIKQTDFFLHDAFSNNQVLKRISGMEPSHDPCFQNFINKENLKFSFQIQIYQLQIPLLNRIEDIRERLNNINSSLEIFQGLAESKFRNCHETNGRCMDETNDWLKSIIDSFSCTIYPNCSKHSIRKRSISDGFICHSGRVINRNYFCDGDCNCGRLSCEDEPDRCVHTCLMFRCKITFRCIPHLWRCDGIDDCGDGTDEEACHSTKEAIHTTTEAIPDTTETIPDTTEIISDTIEIISDTTEIIPTSNVSMQSNTRVDCSIKSGNFLCSNNLCIDIGKVCDGYDDCGDRSDENNQCNGQQCSSECGKKGGVCFIGPSGPKCLYECPPGTYETSKGCSRYPEAPLPTLFQIIEDTPRLITRYSARVKYLKTKTILAFSKALRDIAKCKNGEFTLLSKIIDFSAVIHDEIGLSSSQKNVAITTAADGLISASAQPSIDHSPEK